MAACAVLGCVAHLLKDVVGEVVDCCKTEGYCKQHKVLSTEESLMSAGIVLGLHVCIANMHHKGQLAQLHATRDYYLQQ